jgi:hypothetical protein
MKRKFRHAPRGDAIFGPRTHVCELCDYGFSLIDEGDLAAHEGRHERMLALVEDFGPVMTRIERRAVEAAAGETLASDAPISEKTSAAEALLRARYHEALRNSAKCGRRSVPDWDEFLATVDVRALFPTDVQRALRARYPTLGRGARRVVP